MESHEIKIKRPDKMTVRELLGHLFEYCKNRRINVKELVNDLTRRGKASKYNEDVIVRVDWNEFRKIGRRMPKKLDEAEEEINKEFKEILSKGDQIIAKLKKLEAKCSEATSRQSHKKIQDESREARGKKYNLSVQRNKLWDELYFLKKIPRRIPEE